MSGLQARPYRAALIGCGRIGSEFADDPLMNGDIFTHAEAYATSPRTELVAVCDADPERAERCGRRWGVPWFNGAAELLEAVQPDIVSVCTPTATHYRIARDVLEHARGLRAILCEKPLTETQEEAEELIAMADEGGVTIAMVYMRRFARNFQALRGMIAAGGLGRIQAVSGWYPFGTLHSGTHWFDMLRMLVGEAAWVRATDTIMEAGEDPTLDVSIGLITGALATLRATDVRCFTLFEMDIIGTEGRARIVDSGHLIELSRPGPSRRTGGYSELHPLDHDFGDRRDLMRHAVDDLADALDRGEEPACTAHDGLAALRIGLAARLSASRGGETIEMSAA